jgi:hypothetical protein
VKGLPRPALSQLLAPLALVALTGSAQAVTVEPSDNAVKIDQVDFLFPTATQIDSAWGRLEATASNLQTATGLSSGYLNVFTDQGWVVQNLWVDNADPFSGVVYYFDIASGGATVSAYVDFSSASTAAFNDSTPDRRSFSVGSVGWNAQGAGAMEVVSVGAPPPAGGIMFAPAGAGAGVRVSQPEISNVQTAMNQCFPMSIANSLEYLEDRFGLPVPNDHVPGIKGDNSLVGQLDSKVDRKACTPLDMNGHCTCQNDPPARDDGCGVWFAPMLDAKFRYLAMNNMSGLLVHKHQGVGFGVSGMPAPGVRELAPGDFMAHGSTSADESDGGPGGKVTWDWICDELEHGEDVELVFSYDDANGTPSGGHAVRIFECGETKDGKWLGYVHDRLQTHSDPMDNQGLEEVRVYVKDLDMDQILNFGAPNREIRFAMSESIAPEPVPALRAWSMVVLALLLLGGSALWTRAWR